MSSKPTSGQWKDSHSGEGVFLWRDYFRVARDSGAIAFTSYKPTSHY
jgi:hypothetical protein